MLISCRLSSGYPYLSTDKKSFKNPINNGSDKVTHISTSVIMITTK